MSITRPHWLKVKIPTNINFKHTNDIIKQNHIKTICEEAACPNISSCWSQKHAAFMILGTICTRACRFCNVITGKPGEVNPHEPENLYNTVKEMHLKHVVITSPNRDDLIDGGASQFVAVIQKLRQLPKITIEVLTPDFLNKPNAYEAVVDAKPDVFNHNIETVAALYRTVRPGANYFNSLNLLHKIKERDDTIFTKSGFMVGLGETEEQITQLMDDLRRAGVDFITIGQYLQPTPKHLPIARYVTPDEFDYYGQLAKAKGFLMVSSSPLTRSSYHADEDFALLVKAKNAKYL